MNYQQDLTPQERVDGELLRHLLGASEQACRDSCHGFADGNEQASCGASCGGCDMSAAWGTGFGVPGGVLAALYVPLQQYDDLYDEETALRRGTLFRALDLPFYGGKEGKFCE